MCHPSRPHSLRRDDAGAVGQYDRDQLVLRVGDADAVGVRGALAGIVFSFDNLADRSQIALDERDALVLTGFSQLKAIIESSRAT